MKKLLLSLAICAACNVGFSQTITKLENGIYTSVTVAKTSEPAKYTGNIFKDSKGAQYPILISANGKYFIVRTSAKTGKTYKQYLTL